MRHVLAETKGNGKYALTGTDYPVSKSGRTKDAIETPAHRLAFSRLTEDVRDRASNGSVCRCL